MELNEKLARWVGFWSFTPNEKVFDFGVNPNGKIDRADFTFSLDACFKWLVPKLFNYELYKGLEPGKPVRGRSIARVWLNDASHSAIAFEDNPALALCKAIEQLIDKEIP